jgi:hypothetical protein
LLRFATTSEAAQVRFRGYSIEPKSGPTFGIIRCQYINWRIVRTDPEGRTMR